MNERAITRCTCGWKLLAEGMRLHINSGASIPTDLGGVVIFACPDCGMEWEAEVVITYAGRAGESRPEPS